jgi:hypothetical protein
MRLSSGATPFLAIALASGLAGPASAAKFVWLDDPNSYPDFSGAMSSCGVSPPCGNSITYSGFEAVNTGTAEADVGLFLPFIWPRDESQSTPQQAIAWNNGLGGWYSPNFDNLGTSLLVTVDIFSTTPGDIPNSTVLAGNVADGTGLSVFGPSSSSPSLGIPPSWPIETLAATDALPFVDLGSFAANQEKPFGLEFTYTFGDGLSCDVMTISCRTSIYPVTLAPDTVPEPSTWAMMLAGFSGLGLLALRRRSTA